MIEEEFVQFETSKLLKAAGFPQNGYMHYQKNGKLVVREIAVEDEFVAPTQAVAMRWLREEHKISVEPHITLDETWLCDAWEIKVIQNLNDEDLRYPTYEAAAEAGIQAACKYLTEKGGEG